VLPTCNLMSPSPYPCTLLWLQVNLAARLESMCKQYGVEILISGRMRELAGEAFIARRVDRVVAYGRRGATDIYELVATQGTALLEQVFPLPSAVISLSYSLPRDSLLSSWPLSCQSCDLELFKV
jgi:hypothetical protein